MLGSELLLRAGSGGSGGNGVPVRNGLVAEYKFDECRNLLKFSQDFTNPVWELNTCTVTPNAGIAPDGTMTASKINFVTAYTNITQYFTPSFGKELVFSVYVKAGSQAPCEIYIEGEAKNYVEYGGVSVNLITGESVPGGGSPPTVISVGNGWYRVSFSIHSGWGGTLPDDAYIDISNLAGDTVYIWGAQVEEIPVTYIKNLLLSSEQIDADQGVSTVETSDTPLGYSTATEVHETVISIDHLFSRVFAMGSGGAHTISTYVKKLGRRYICVGTLCGDSTWRRTWFDLDTHTVLTNTNSAATITAVGTGGWYRISVTTPAIIGGAQCGSFVIHPALADNNHTEYVGDPAQGMIIGGFQVEIGSVMTSYEARTSPAPVSPYFPTTDKQFLMDYSRPRKNLLLPNQANGCSDGVATWFTKATAGDTVSASTTVAWQGTYSAKVICANAAASEGLKTTDAIYSLNPSSPYTASAYVYGSVAAETVKIGIEELTDAGVSVGVTYANLTLSASWQRVTVTRTFGATGRGARIYVITQSQQACTMYVDGLQLEAGSTATAWEAPPNIGILGSTTGADTNDPTWTGEGAYFTTDDYIVLPSTIKPTTGLTIFAVFNKVNDTEARIISCTEQGGWFLGINADGATKNICALRRNSGYGTVVYDLTGINGWMTSAITFDGQYLKAWLNGNYVGLTNDAGGIYPLQYSAAPLCIGCEAGATDPTVPYLTGNIAYLFIYDRALTQAEISKNYTYLKSYLKKNRGIALP